MTTTPTPQRPDARELLRRCSKYFATMHRGGSVDESVFTGLRRDLHTFLHVPAAPTVAPTPSEFRKSRPSFGQCDSADALAYAFVPAVAPASAVGDLPRYTREWVDGPDRDEMGERCPSGSLEFVRDDANGEWVRYEDVAALTAPSDAQVSIEAQTSACRNILMAAGFLVQKADAQPAQAVTDAITGEMWKAGRIAFVMYADRYSSGTKEPSYITADVAPAEIYKAMERARSAQVAVGKPDADVATEPLLRLREVHPTPKPSERSYAHESAGNTAEAVATVMGINEKDFPIVEWETDAYYLTPGTKLYTHPAKPAQDGAGLVLVPLIPTEAMLHAGMVSVHVEDENGMIGPAFYPLHIYRAMVLAAGRAEVGGEK